MESNYDIINELGERGRLFRTISDQPDKFEAAFGLPPLITLTPGDGDEVAWDWVDYGPAAIVTEIDDWVGRSHEWTLEEPVKSASSYNHEPSVQVTGVALVRCPPNTRCVHGLISELPQISRAHLIAREQRACLPVSHDPCETRRLCYRALAARSFGTTDTTGEIEIGLVIFSKPTFCKVSRLNRLHPYISTSHPLVTRADGIVVGGCVVKQCCARGAI